MTKLMTADNIKVSVASAAGITSAALYKFIDTVNPVLDFAIRGVQAAIAVATFLYILHKLRELKNKK